MVDTAPPQRYEQAYYWLKCTGCAKGLWKRFPDRIEATISMRGGEKRTINVSLEAASSIKVTCEKCGRVTVPAVEAG